MGDAKKGAEFLDRKPKLSSVKSHLGEVRELWKQGLPPGDKTGWASLDQFYTVQPGQLSIITGWPSSGKSEWLDALLVNLARQGWKIAVFSFENQPVSLHISKMLEKLSGKPFREGPSARISEADVSKYTEELDASFSFSDTSDGALSAEDVIAAAEPWLSKFEGKRGLVIDPWNELEHWVPQGQSKTDYISHTLTVVRNWARKNKVHVWIVAHPAKVRREEGKLPIPRPDMISDSQHWWNKADCAITVWRDFEDPDSPDTDIHVQKCRFKHIGRIGMTTLRYSIATGQYREMPHVVKQQTEDYKRARYGD